MASTPPLIRDSLYLLNLYGLDPFRQNMWSTVRTIISAIILKLILLLIILEAICNLEHKNSAILMGHLLMGQQIFYKFLVTIINKKQFAKIIRSVEQFGPSKNFQDLIQFHTEFLERYNAIGKKMLKYALIIIIFMSCLIYFIPIVLRIKTKILPIYLYSAKSPYFEMTYMYVFVCALCYGIFIISYDYLFALLVIHLVSELQILKREIRAMPRSCTKDEENLEDVGLFVNRHNLVLECIRDINNVYSKIFLNHFLNSSVCLCVCLLGIIGSEYSTGVSASRIKTLSSTLLLFVNLAELLIYCVGGTFLTKECEEVAHAAYGSKWWMATQPKFRQSLVLVIQRSHRASILIAGGVFPVNVESFVKILKAAYSFYSLAHSIYKN